MLVADDDQSLRARFRAALERAGFRVVVASNGHRALELARTEPVSVMLMDIHMPGLDGLGALRELRTSGGMRKLPIVMVTGSATEADRISGLDLGANDVIAKPVSVPELIARVRAQIRGHTVWTEEQEVGRESRRRLAAFLPELPRDAPLLTLASRLTEGLPDVIGVDSVAIPGFERGSARTVATHGSLADRFVPGKLVPRTIGSDLARHAQSGAWLDVPTGEAPPRTESARDAIGQIEMAFVPFSLGSRASATGCLVYARQQTGRVESLAHRLPDLIDATDMIVTILRPAIEHAETKNAAILKLRRVIAGRRFALHLQPIVRLETGTMVAVEALSRFEEDAPPDVKFAEAHRLGLGLALERAAVTEAIKCAEPLPPGIALSVNVSPDVLEHDRALPDIIANANRPIIVELTEHERIDDYDAVRAAFQRLGPDVRLAVDDAGSGYASLRHIFSLQPAFVKLDIQWVRGIGRDPIRRSLVSGLAYFASETGCDLIAEGIEHEEEREVLVELGVKLGQGFLLGRPQPASELFTEGEQSAS